MNPENKNSETKKKYQKIPINNSFIRDKYIWDRDNELYDKIKVRISADSDYSNKSYQDCFVGN